MPRYVLCRPQGGLNDALCQIERCCRYAERFGRSVIVDTNFQHAKTFWSPFSTYFVSKQPTLHLDYAPFANALENASVSPAHLYGHLNTYRTADSINSLVEANDTLNRELSFDFTIDHREDVLVHHQWGGGKLSHSAGRRMSLQKDLWQALIDRLEIMGGEFDGVHIRHTDLKSDYSPALEFFKQRDFQKLFVATDNAEILDEFRAQFGAQRIHSFAQLPKDTGTALHLSKPDGESMDQFNRDAILDLFTLAFSQHLFICQTINNPFWNCSGFSILARALQTDAAMRQSFLEQPRLFSLGKN